MIKVFSALFKFYLEASLHVAFAVYALFYAFVITNQLVYDEAIAYTLFYGSITGYNFVKFAPVAKLHHSSLTKSLKIIQLFSFLSFIALLYYLYQLPLRTLITLVIGIFLVFAYVFPFFKNKNLRSIAKLKIYLVAFCWSLAVVIAPVIHYEIGFSVKVLLEIIQVFVLVIALIIPFDIRDLEYDSVSLKTIPQKIGVKKSKIIACILLGVYLLIDIFLKQSILNMLPSMLMVAIASLLIIKMPKKTIKYYCSFGIESLPILKLVILLAIIRF